MANNYHGKTILAELFDNETIANTDSDAAVFVGNETNGSLWVEIYAGATAVALGNTDALEFYIQTGDDDTLADCEAPLSKANAGGQVNATGTFIHEETTEIAADAATYGVLMTATTNGFSFTKGDLIAEIGIPQTMMRLCGHTYVQLKMILTGTVPGTIDAFIVSRV